MKRRAFGNSLLYAITDRRLTGLSHAQMTEEFLRGGCRVVQLREKELPIERFYQDAFESVTLAKRFNATIIINDYVELAAELRASGVHLGQEDSDPIQARRILGEEAFIGLSTHSLDQALLAMSLPVDYIAVGPIYQTSTKPEARINGSSGLELLKEVIQRVDKPVVAIGGITLARLDEVMMTGVEQVAVISDLLCCKDIADRCSVFLQKLQALHRAGS